MREANSQELLRLLRLQTPCSRADLVRASGLTAPTVSAAIESLHRRGLVRFLGAGESSGGRPPHLMEFNAAHGYVFGADIGGSAVRVALADLSGMIIGRWRTSVKAGRSPDAIVQAIATGIEFLRSEYQIAPKKMLELAVGAPGITNAQAGRVLSAPNLNGWQDVPLRDLLQAKTGIATTVENDVNLAALGESWCGVAKGVRNFVFLAIGTGVGAGIFINGHLHHGADWSAGEVGYLMISGLPSGPLAVDHPGALENVIGGMGIEAAWEASRKNGGRPPCATEIFDRAAAGDADAARILAHTAEHLATAIVNMGLVLDMSLVVLGGGVGNHRGLQEATAAVLAKNQFARPKLMVSSLSGDAQVQGAVWLALQAAEVHGFRPLSSARNLQSSAKPKVRARFAGQGARN